MEEVEFFIRCRIDFKFFCERMLGMNEFGGIHQFQLEWFYLVNNNPRSLIEAPSGFSKTEIIGVAYPLWRMMNESNLKILLVSKTIKQAEANILGRIKGYIEDNEFLKDYIPTGLDKVWNKEEIKLRNGCWAKNVPYSINIKSYRAHIIICDEIDSYLPPYDIFFTHVLSRIIPGGKIIGISTPEGPTKLIAKIRGKKGTNFVYQKYVAIINCKDPEDLSTGESIWPERFNVPYMMSQRAEMGENAFQMNYMCNTKTEYSDAIFQIKTILDTFNDDLSFDFNLNPEAQYIIGADFAISKGVDADYDAYCVLEKVEEQVTIKHIEIHKGWNRIQKVDRIYELANMFKSKKTTKVIADNTNIGPIIIADLRSKGLSVVLQSFTPAERKRLFISFNNILEGGYFRIPRGGKNPKVIEYTDLLLEQAIGIKRTTSEAGNELFKSTAAHDDILVSVAMAASELARMKKITVLGMSKH